MNATLTDPKSEIGKFLLEVRRRDDRYRQLRLYTDRSFLLDVLYGNPHFVMTKDGWRPRKIEMPQVVSLRKMPGARYCDECKRNTIVRWLWIYQVRFPVCSVCGPRHAPVCTCYICHVWRWSHEWEVADLLRDDNYRQYQWGYERGRAGEPKYPSESRNPYWDHGYRAGSNTEGLTPQALHRLSEAAYAANRVLMEEWVNKGVIRANDKTKHSGSSGKRRHKAGRLRRLVSRTEARKSPSRLERGTQVEREDREGLIEKFFRAWVD